MGALWAENRLPAVAVSVTVPTLAMVSGVKVATPAVTDVDTPVPLSVLLPGVVRAMVAGPL
jgi:hypothetical protein